MKVKTILALLLLFCFSVTTIAQTKPAAPPEPQKKAEDTDDDVVRITTNLVQVDAVVTKGGKMVTNLTADDFEIYEDGRKQTITSFAYISNVPSAPAGLAPEKGKAIDVVPVSPVKRDDVRRTVALVVDDLGLSAESVMQVKKQLRKFITEELSPNDLVAVIRTSGELGALQQFTNDKRILSRAVDRVRWNACSRAGVSVLPRLQVISSQFEDPELSCGGGSYYGTMKALRFIIDAMGQLPGRKSMVILSDSLPVESQEIKFESPELNAISNTTRFPGLLQRIAEKAIRASVVIYAVDTQGLQYTGITAADSMPLTRQTMNASINNVMSTRAALLWRRSEGGQLISRQTGGFQVRNSNSFELDRIMEDQNGYYLIGYRPTTETFNRKFHHIKAKVKRSGMTVRTRFGFLG
ncbi:MAG TPA: VWA domain-containing protein, partial [Pyrinomonadaceae bacterium]